MNIDITSAAITTIISAITAASINLWMNKKGQKKDLDNRLESILKIAIQYPYLESNIFANSWTENRLSSDEKYLRYDHYCNLIFNYLEDLCAFYKFDKKKIMKQNLNIKNWIRIHRQCWENPSNEYENVECYDPAFREIIKEYMA